MKVLDPGQIGLAPHFIKGLIHTPVRVCLCFNIQKGLCVHTALFSNKHDLDLQSKCKTLFKALLADSNTNNENWSESECTIVGG